jgi:methylmalonyl-CoA mutase
MINHMIREADFPTPKHKIEEELVLLKEKHWVAVARLVTAVEENSDRNDPQGSITIMLEPLLADAPTIPVLGITGTGAAGKSSLTDELVRRYLEQYPDRSIAIISIDPSKVKTGGALLDDRIRMFCAEDDGGIS